MNMLSDLFKNAPDTQMSHLAKTCSKCGIDLTLGRKPYHQDGNGGWECMEHIEVQPKEKTVSDYKEELEDEIYKMLMKFSYKHNVEITKIGLINIAGEVKVKVTAEI